MMKKAAGKTRLKQKYFLWVYFLFSFRGDGSFEEERSLACFEVPAQPCIVLSSWLAVQCPLGGKWLKRHGWCWKHSCKEH